MNITPFEFESNTVRTITDEHGEPWFVLRDVLKAMGSSVPVTTAKASIIEGLGEGFTSDKHLQTAGGMQQSAIISEPAVTYLVSRSNTETGKRLNRWIHSEVLPSIRKIGSYATPTQGRIEDFQILGIIANNLNLSPSSSLELHRSLAERIAPNIALALPAYAVDAPNGQISSEATASLTELLKQHDVGGIKTPAMNKLLEAHGYIATIERRGSKGQIKKFKNITEKGLRFGKNMTHGDNPRETQPHWYISTFPQLIDELGLAQ